MSMERITDRDKIYHFLVCLAISVASPSAAVGAAIAKEYADMRMPGNHWCWLDIAADVAGILIGTHAHYYIGIPSLP